MTPEFFSFAFLTRSSPARPPGRLGFQNLEILEVKGGGYQDLEGDLWNPLGWWSMASEKH